MNQTEFLNDDWGEDSIYFNDDFVMASDPELVFDNDLMYT